MLAMNRLSITRLSKISFILQLWSPTKTKVPLSAEYLAKAKGHNFPYQWMRTNPYIEYYDAHISQAYRSTFVSFRCAMYHLVAP